MLDHEALAERQSAIEISIVDRSTNSRPATFQDLQASIEGVKELAAINANLTALTTAVLALSEAVKSKGPA